MRVMHQSVQDRVCRCRVIHQPVPLAYRELAHHDGTALSVADAQKHELIRTLRLTHGKSFRETARLAGVSKMTVIRVCRVLKVRKRKLRYQNSSSGIITSIGLQNPIVNVLNTQGFTSTTRQSGHTTACGTFSNNCGILD